MDPIPITRVRYGDEEARSKLQMFVFEGRYGGSRAPRGIDPEFVSRFIRESLQPSSPADAYAAVLSLMRFYERADALPAIGMALTGHESTSTDLLRSAYALQAAGDFGTAAQTAQAASYFDRIIAPHSALNAGLYPILFDTLVALAPAGSPAQLEQRLRTDIARAGAGRRASEAGMMQYDQLVSVNRNIAPRTQLTIALKTRLAVQAPGSRTAELVRIYVGVQGSGPMLTTWAGRMLRKQAREGDPAPVYEALARVIEDAHGLKLGNKQADAIVLRAAQALVYLHGPLTPRLVERYVAAGASPANFLWDD